MIERAARAARAARPGHDPVPRRGPPLQQGPAGRAAAVGRGRPARADRRDHREPVLRGQPAAAVAVDAVPARAAVGRESLTTLVAARAWRRRARPPTTTPSTHLVDRAGRRRPPDAHGLEVAVALAGARASRRAACTSPWTTPRRRSARRRCATAATSTTTSSRAFIKSIRGLRPRRRRCTGWPACSRRGRTPASSPAAW